MPNYLALCKKCDHNWEVFRLMKDKGNLGKCPKCDSKRVTQDYSGHHGNHVFEKRFFEHLSTEGVYIESKKQLREECVARGFDPQKVPALN